MSERKQFEMTEADLAGIMEKIEAALKVSGMFLSGGQPMGDVQATANSAWCELGDRMGFDGMTVTPVYGAGNRVFTAIAKATT